MGIIERQNFLLWLGIGITVISIASGVVYNKSVDGPKLDTFCVVAKKYGTKMMDDRNGSGIYVKLKYDHLDLEETRFIENPFIAESYEIGKHYTSNKSYVGIKYDELIIMTGLIVFLVLGVVAVSMKDSYDNYN